MIGQNLETIELRASISKLVAAVICFNGIHIFSAYIPIDLGNREPGPKRDESFISIVAFRDTTKNYALISQLHVKCLLQNPFANPKLLVTESDYTTFPPTIAVNPVEKYRPHPHNSNAHAHVQYDDLVEEANKQIGKSALQIVIVPRGASVQKYWMVRPVDLPPAEPHQELTRQDFDMIKL